MENINKMESKAKLLKKEGDDLIGSNKVYQLYDRHLKICPTHTIKI